MQVVAPLVLVLLKVHQTKTRSPLYRFEAEHQLAEQMQVVHWNLLVVPAVIPQQHQHTQPGDLVKNCTTSGKSSIRRLVIPLFSFWCVFGSTSSPTMQSSNNALPYWVRWMVLDDGVL